MNAIEVENLRKRFNGVEVLKGISFRVRRGEIFGFLGPNGAGKTTTMRILTGIIKPDAGKAIVNGCDVAKESLEVKKFIGVLPEVSNAYPDLTAWQNLMLIARLYGMKKSEAEERGRRLLREFGIYERRDFRVKVFSKGMKQRLMLCMALMSDPEILFLDEPTSGLDVQSARMMREKILELAGEKTVFLTSHNMEEVNRLCDEIAIIRKGEIIEIDSPERIRQKVGGSIAIEVSFSRAIRLENAERCGDRYLIYTANPHEEICRIVETAKRSDAEILSLNTRVPTLEEAFVKILEAKI